MNSNSHTVDPQLLEAEAHDGITDGDTTPRSGEARRVHSNGRIRVVFFKCQPAGRAAPYSIACWTTEIRTCLAESRSRASQAMIGTEDEIVSACRTSSIW